MPDFLGKPVHNENSPVSAEEEADAYNKALEIRETFSSSLTNSETKELDKELEEIRRKISADSVQSIALRILAMTRGNWKKETPPTQRLLMRALARVYIQKLKPDKR